MNKYLITGIPGTGKSTVAEELNKKGIRSIDIDSIDGMCHWENEQGERVDYITGIGKDWLDRNSYVCDLKKLEEMLTSEKGDIVVVGIVTNQKEILDLFDKVFLFYCDEKIFLHRLNNRDTNDFANNEEDQKHILGFYKEFESDMIKSGAIQINTGNSLEGVVEKIVSEIKQVN
jgi:dephospho-CoA kinase